MRPSAILKPLPVITFIIAILSVITLLTYRNLTQNLPREWQQTLSTSSTCNDSSYIAPMIGCDRPKKDIVEDKFRVFLHQGCSLVQHKTFVGNAVDFDSALEHVFNDTANHGLSYGGTLSKDALAAVRADIGVDLVTCAGRAYHF